MPLEDTIRFRSRFWSSSEYLARKEVDCFYVSANGLEKHEIGHLWDSIALTDLEQDILSALRIVAPEIERLSLVGDPRHDIERIAVIKMAGLTRPIPLSSLGDGMNRMFGIMLALVNAKNGMLLIDEIENGIHYSVQPNLWSLVFNAAHRLNVQVFATTHSWDCITSFHKVAAENKEKNGMLIRLEAKEGMTNAVLFDEKELSIVSRDQIEVR